jgi:hypothetical protein
MLDTAVCMGISNLSVFAFAIFQFMGAVTRNLAVKQAPKMWIEPVGSKKQSLNWQEKQ